MRSRNQSKLFLTFVSALSLGAAVVLAEPPEGPGDRPPRPPTSRPARPERPRPEAKEISGTFENFNLGARGEINGLILKSGSGLIQINVPPPVGAMLASSVVAGDAISGKGVPQMGPPEHAVYGAVSLTLKDGKTVAVPAPGDEKPAHVEGTIKLLNYGHNGEVDGAILDSGEFIHIGPREAMELKLAVGQKLTVDGKSHPILGNDKSVIEADSVNGKTIDRPEPREGPDGPGGPGGGPRGKEMREGGPGGRGPGGPGGQRPPRPANDDDMGPPPPPPQN